jgi:hypothetical protein
MLASRLASEVGAAHAKLKVSQLTIGKMRRQSSVHAGQVSRLHKQCDKLSPTVHPCDVTLASIIKGGWFNVELQRAPALWHRLPGAQNEDENVADGAELGQNSLLWLHNRVLYAQV